jgi:hypothetical protein
LFDLTGGTALNGSTTSTSTTTNQTGPASVANFTNGGSFTVAAGQTLVWNGGTNTSSGRLVVNGTANVSDFVSDGQLNIPNGGVMNNTLSPLVLGGGSRTFIGSAAAPGGAINLGSQTLELNGGLLVNNGTVSGTTNVNFGAVAKGAGAYGVVNVNQGGVYAPGNSPGISTAASVLFDNAPTIVAGPTLMIELAGVAPGTGYDQLHVTGNLSLGGTLAVSLINGFTPVAGSSFDILDWGALSGTFASLDLPTLAADLSWNTSQLYTTGVLSVLAAGLAGDYNQNGTVDAADYVVWRNGLGTTYTQNDYNIWRANFGATAGGSGANAGPVSSANATIPEPATWVMMLGAFCLLAWGNVRRGRACGAAPAYRLLTCRAPRIVLFAVLGITSPHRGGSASAQNFWGADGVGNWNVAANWSAGVPKATTDAQINNGGTARLFDPLSREEFMAWTDGPKRVGRILQPSHPSVAHIK